MLTNKDCRQLGELIYNQFKLTGKADPELVKNLNKFHKNTYGEDLHWYIKDADYKTFIREIIALD